LYTLGKLLPEEINIFHALIVTHSSPLSTRLDVMVALVGGMEKWYNGKRLCISANALSAGSNKSALRSVHLPPDSTLDLHNRRKALMVIDRIDTYYVHLPLVSPWRTAYGEDAEVHSVLVRMVSGEHEGWGETTPLQAPTYSPETAMSVYHVITEFIAPALVGREFETAEDLLDAYKWVKGNPFAKAGPETAWWMLKAQMEAQPLHRLLGGTTKNVQAGADFGVQDSIDILLEKIQGAVDTGFKRVKLKVRPGWDLEMLRAVRASFPKHTFHIDCNAGYSLDDMTFFKSVDRLELAMIEQPLYHTDLLEHAELQKQLQTPICLDESIKSVRDFEWALKLGSCRVLNIKMGRVGGLSVAVKLHDMARDAGIPCWVGGMLESAIGSGISIELATLDNFSYPNDLFSSSFFYRQDLTEPETVLNDDCTFTPSTVPGTPYKPVFERIERSALFSKTSVPL
jgi:O-succinylbenzoate synthase